MRSLKIVSAAAFLVFTFCLIVAFKKANDDAIALHKTLVIAEFHQNEADKVEAKLYKLKQKKIQLALENYFKKAIASGDIVGAGVSIVKGDSILITSGFGKKSSNENDKVNGETVFRLGSLSKGFTGVLAAGLESEGKLNWNDKIVDYIPEFKFGSKQHTQKINLSHILSHTSGTPYHSYTNLIEAGLPMKSIASRFNVVQPIHQPGEAYSYQNAMFSLSQEVMLKATGKEIQTLLEDKFFTPLGMSTISMDHKTLLENDNVAIPHVKRRNGWKSIALRNRYYNAVAAGGINASSQDMAKWMRFLLGHNPEVLSKKDMEQAFQPVVSVNNRRKYYQRWEGHKQSSYGLGWRIHQFQESASEKEFTIWHHGGSVNNFRNEIAIYPEADLGICVLLNGNSRLAKTVIPDLYQIVKENNL